MSKEESKEVNAYFITEMIRAILSACVQIGRDSVSKDEIRQFYQYDNFDECLKESYRYLSRHTYKNSKETETYSFSLQRKLFDGTILSGLDIIKAIKKSDFL